MSIAEFEALDEYSLTNITASVRSACVLVALQPTCELTSILHKLSQAFKNESSASIGVLKQSDSSSITWENSRSLDMVDQEDLAFFPRKLVDRTCLIQPSWQKPPKAERYYGSRTLQELLAFINAKCSTFRQLDGSLSSAGLARKRIIDNLYRVPNSDGPNHASYSGPVNIGSTCERIPLPSKEKFFHEYFFRSKPVVITGKKKFDEFVNQIISLSGSYIIPNFFIDPDPPQPPPPPPYQHTSCCQLKQFQTCEFS